MRNDVRGEEEEQHEAREALRPPREGPAAQEATRRAATPCDTLQRSMCCIIVQRSCIIVQRRTVNCNSGNAPQHTILQRACRDTSMHPMAEEYALMQPFENVMRRCNPLQPIIIQHARRHTSCRTGYLRNRHVYCNRCVPKLQRRKAFAAYHIAERLLQ